MISGRNLEIKSEGNFGEAIGKGDMSENLICPKSPPKRGCDGGRV